MKTIKYINDYIAVKGILSIILMLIVFAVLVCLIGYRSFTWSFLDQYSYGAFRTADTAVLMVDGDKIDDYLASDGKGEEYEEVYRKLDSLCNSTRSTFVYVIIPDRPDYAHITFLFSTIRRGSGYKVYDFRYYRETTNDEYKEKYKRLMNGESTQEVVVRDKGYIETDPHITAMVPIRGTDGKTKAILCVQRQMDALMESRNSYIQKVGFVTFLVIIVIAAGQGSFLEKVLIGPVATITREAHRFAEENVASDVKLRNIIKGNDEIADLAGSIDQMEEQISDYVQNLTRVTAENERIGTELSLAGRIQAAMIPAKFPAFPGRTDVDLYASMDPAKEVGGDFYDFFLVDDDHLCLVMADVSGKGVPASLFMMASKIILQSCAMLGSSASEILTKTNEAICSNNSANMFVTVWVGILEMSTGILTAANAGHEYPVFKKPDGGFEMLKDKHGFVIGGMEGMKYTEYQLKLEPGTKIFLYTDGVPEAAAADNSMFGTDRMLDALNADPDASPEKILRNMRSAVDGFVRDAEQFDDLTMMCVEYKG